MPPKQATLGKFFGRPNGSASKPQQSKLAFQKPKASAATKKDSSDVNGAPKSEDEETEVLKGKSDDKDIEMGGNANAKESSTRAEEPISDGEPQKSPPKRRNREVKEDKDDDDDEPVRKRSRRGVKKEMPKLSAKGSSTESNGERPPKMKKDAIEAGRGKAETTKSLLKAASPEKPTAIASRGTGSSKTADGPSKEQQSVQAKSTQEKDESVSEEAASEEEEEAAESDDEDKPEVVAKAREKIQSTLKGGGKDPYPDWKPGAPVPYAALCTTFSLIEMTTKRLIIIPHCSLFLRQVLRLTPEDLLPTTQLMINKLAADYSGIELGIGESLIMKAIGESTGRSLQDIKTDQNKIGDLGLVAAKSRGKQRTMFQPKPLTVRGVHEGLMAIATTTGDGSQGRKVSGIIKLLSAADTAPSGKGSKGIDISENKGGASESKFIVRFLEGKLRLGLAEKSVIVGLANAMVYHEIEKKTGKLPSSEELTKGEATLKAVYSELPSYDVIIPAMLEHGIFNLSETCKLQPGVPLKPMLAKPTKSITEVLDRFEGKNFTCEYKYDGERAQIHYVAEDSPEQYSNSVVKSGKGFCAIFSRNSEDLSKKYPDILEKLQTWIKPEAKSFVLDCETVAWDSVEKKVLPFQQLMTRKRKDVKVEDVKVKVCVFAFDMLFYNGESVVKKSLRERRELLYQTFKEVEGEFSFAQHGNSNDLDEIQTLLDESIRANCEGLMVKLLDTKESGYEPAERTRNWLKVKKDYLAGLGDSLDLVVLGAYFGKGKRTSVYGAFLLACYDSSKETYETVCNIGTGFSEAILEELYSKLSEITVDRAKPYYSHSTVPKDQPDVWFEPRYVWEVKTADLTMSPRYKAGADYVPKSKGGGGRGISLRFPRFLHQRDDKKPEEATSSKMVVEMYEKQSQEGKGESRHDDGTTHVDDDFEY